jgi:hypothetical protein
VRLGGNGIPDGWREEIGKGGINWCGRFWAERLRGVLMFSVNSTRYEGGE